MPEKEIRERGGAIRWRTIELPGGKYEHLAIVRKAGPRGGRTVGGKVHKKKWLRCDKMVRIKKAKEKDKYTQGIHLYNPSEMDIENAKEDAYAKGFKTIWVHKGKKVMV